MTSAPVITKQNLKYPEGFEPTVIIPETYEAYRYVIGRPGKNPLIALCMNPSKAQDGISDRTVNLIINTAKKRGYDGWFVVNICAIRGTDAKTINPRIDHGGKSHLVIANENAEHIVQLLNSYPKQPVWAAWGTSTSPAVNFAKYWTLNAIAENTNNPTFAIGNISKAGNPHHPLYTKLDDVHDFNINDFLARHINSNWNKPKNHPNS